MAQNRSNEEANTFWVGGLTQRITSVSALDTASALAHSFLNKVKTCQGFYSQQVSLSSMLYPALSGLQNKLLFITSFKKQVSKTFIFHIGTSC